MVKEQLKVEIKNLSFEIFPSARMIVEIVSVRISFCYDNYVIVSQFALTERPIKHGLE